MADLLLELFSEEIPARMQPRAAEDLKRLVTGHMVEAGLTYTDGAAFATPRRLVLSLTGLPEVTPDTVEERKGPRVDAPEQALEGFLRSAGVVREALEAREDKKGAVWFATIRREGRPAEAVIAEAVEATVRHFPWPKSMRWGTGSLRWVRPLSRILCVLTTEAGARVVPFEIDGLSAGDETEGHRFMAPGAVRVTGFEDYEVKLTERKVMLDPAARAERIWHDATQAAFALGLEAVEDKGLLAEVAGLVEWPVVLTGPIGAAFLDLPAEVLQTSMREHQKFFSLRNPSTGRIERFATVANIEAPDGGTAILDGNQRVLAARLSDAKFFWENDLRVVEGKGDEGLAAMAAPLATVVFHQKLGSQAERIERLAGLARELAPAVRADPDLAARAARVVKADLASEMVYEFPELQGVMGAYYARAAGLPEPVATAAEAHYRPLGPGDAVPSEPVSAAVALADKIDMLTGFWAIGETPTGTKDPFALRRAALGVIRIAIEHDIRESLIALSLRSFSKHFEEIAARDERALLSKTDLAAALEGVEGDLVDAAHAVLAARHDAHVAEEAAHTGQSLLSALKLDGFFSDRLKVLMRDRGIRHDVIDAVTLRPHQDVIALRVKRAEALQGFLETPDGANLLVAYSRASNIVAAEEAKDGVEYWMPPEVRFAEQDEERAVFGALDQVEPAVTAALEREDFTAAMAEMAKLRAPIDAFFDKVTVNTDNQVLRRNRLCLLTRIRDAMLQVAIWDAIER